jgi:hypothetical protein
MINYDVSTLFSSLSSSSTLSSFNFSDYAAIRNGSYKKLLKSYYAEQSGTSTSSDSTTSKTSTTSTTSTTTDNTELTKVKKNAEALKTSVNALGEDDLWKQTAGAYDTDGIVKAVKEFASDYNDTLTQAGKVSSKEVTQSTKFMTNMTDTMSNALKKVGITAGTDGKLTVDEDTLKSADMSKVKSLFSGDYSYGSQIAQKASSISSAAVMSSSLYSGSGTYSSYYTSIWSQSV